MEHKFKIEIRLESGEYIILVYTEASDDNTIYVIHVRDLLVWIEHVTDVKIKVAHFVNASISTQKRYVKEFLSNIEDSKSIIRGMIVEPSPEVFDTGLSNHMNMVGWIKEVPQTDKDKLTTICQN
jgi:hypothetical protein